MGKVIKMNLEHKIQIILKVLPKTSNKQLVTHRKHRKLVAQPEKVSSNRDHTTQKNHYLQNISKNILQRVSSSLLLKDTKTSFQFKEKSTKVNAQQFVDIKIRENVDL